MKLAKKRIVTLRQVPYDRAFDPTVRLKDCKPVMWMLPVRNKQS